MREQEPEPQHPPSPGDERRAMPEGNSHEQIKPVAVHVERLRKSDGRTLLLYSKS